MLTGWVEGARVNEGHGGMKAVILRLSRSTQGSVAG